MVSKTTLNTLLAGAVALTMAGAATQASAHEDAATAEMEKCYGVAKAGMNDCGNAAKTHTCAGHAATDADGGEWLNLPKGVCDKLTGGSLEPKVADAAAPAEAAPAEAAPADDHGHAH